MIDAPRQSAIAQRLGLRLSDGAVITPATPRIRPIKHLARAGQVRALKGRSRGESQLWVLVLKMHSDQTADVVSVRLGFEESTSADLLILTDGSTVGEVLTACPAILATVHCDDLEGGSDRLVGYVTPEVLATVIRATKLGVDPRTLPMPVGLTAGPRSTSASWLLQLREEAIEALQAMSVAAGWADTGVESIFSTPAAAFHPDAPKSAEILAADWKDWLDNNMALSRMGLRAADPRINRDLRSIRAADFFAERTLEESVLRQLPAKVRIYGTAGEAPRTPTKQLSTNNTAEFKLVGSK